MNNNYYKRVRDGKVLQIWLEMKEEKKMIDYTCEMKYYGEGIDGLIGITLEEFREIGRVYNCFERVSN